MQSFRIPIHFLARGMTNHNNQLILVPTKRNDRLVPARVCELSRINPPKFLGSHVGKEHEAH